MHTKTTLKNSSIYPQLVKWRARLDRYVLSSRLKRAAMLEFFGQFINAGDLCFDVGANKGSRTEMFLELGAKVVCVEPQQTPLAALRKRYGRNPNVVIVDRGVDSEPGVAQLAICEDAHTLSTFSEVWRTKSRFTGNYRWARNETVEMTTLDLLIAQYGLPSFCKVDVEGFELQVLRGLSKPISVILFEFSYELLAETRESLNHLASLAPYEFNYSLSEEMKLACRSWLSAAQCASLLEANRDPLFWGDLVGRLR